MGATPMANPPDVSATTSTGGRGCRALLPNRCFDDSSSRCLIVSRGESGALRNRHKLLLSHAHAPQQDVRIVRAAPSVIHVCRSGRPKGEERDDPIFAFMCPVASQTHETNIELRSTRPHTRVAPSPCRPSSSAFFDSSGDPAHGPLLCGGREMWQGHVEDM